MILTDPKKGEMKPKYIPRLKWEPIRPLRVEQSGTYGNFLCILKVFFILLTFLSTQVFSLLKFKIHRYQKLEISTIMTTINNGVYI